MTQDVLTVFRAHPDHVFPVAREERLVGDVTDVGEKISPLRREEVHQIESLRAGFQQGCRRRQEVDVRVRTHPSLGAKVRNAFDLQLQLALLGSNLKPSTHRLIFKSLRHLQVHVAYR